MIAKDFRGAGFRGALNYVLSPEHKPQIIAREFLLGETPKDLAYDFGRLRRLRPDVEKPVHHIALSFAREDRRLSPDELERIAVRYLEEIGYKDSQYVVVEHREKPHQHIHIIANRIRLDGTLVRYQYRDWEKGMEVVRGIERDFGLRVVERNLERGEGQPTQGQVRLATEHKVPADRLLLQHLVRDAWRGQPSATEFVDRLKARQVRVRFYGDEAGNVTGISYGFGKHDFGGYALGPSYTWKGVQREGVTYERSRDRATVEGHAGGIRATRVNGRRVASPGGAIERARSMVKGATLGRPSVSEFIGRLESLGIRVELNVARTGYVSGVRYHLDGHAFKGSELGREFSWVGIQKQGVTYDAERDAEAVIGAGAKVLPDAELTNPAPTPDRADVLRMEGLLRGAFADRPTLTDFAERLEAAGVRVRLHEGSSGDITGIGFVIGGIGVRGRDLGPEFSWDELRRWHVRYVQADDQAVARIVAAHHHEDPGLSDKQGPGSQEVERRTLAQIVAGARLDHPSFSEYIQRLEKRGVEVRVLVDTEYHPFSVRYLSADLSFPGEHLGPGHSWHRLQQTVALDSPHDLDTLARVSTVTPRERTRSKDHTPEQLAQVRLVVEGVLADRPTLTQFVSRVEGAGIEIRLQADREGRPSAISYGDGTASIRGADLGPGHSWTRLARERLSFDPERDREAFARIVLVQERPQPWQPPRPVSAEDRAQVRVILDQAARNRPTLSEFVSRAEGRGVEVRIDQDHRGRVVGVGYALGGRAIPADQLGRGYTWSDLKRVPVVYHPLRDQSTVRARSRTLGRPAFGLQELSRAYQTARSAAAWVQQPHVQALRLGARLLGRVATSVVRDLVHSPAQRHALSPRPVGRVEVPLGQVPKPYGPRHGPVRESAADAVTELARVAIAMAERYGEPSDQRGKDALASLRRHASQPAKELLKMPAKSVLPDR